ncbi:alkaline phosphatase family protein [Sphingomonas spermidinifaciens]|uniref:Alkaline phosphatase family protein n=1 Tax=Sphingomonas spermidinifaciens TaxID=1141889 RepID=A0A2A4B1T2_9SPHN|nr:ectonucleotide pyrophosphatase/phosphodiesterase [Sphingomonas spermidinifaciens]PCD02007.1 alkaline phosphatase family protein [Sphingomonas spermidinifaciens]
MKLLSRLLALAGFAALQACMTPPVDAPATRAVVEARAPITLLVSIDGFRPDYLDRGDTPVLSRLAAEGVRGSMQPSFPTKTFPNHYAIVTGLHPDRNGIVANKMEDASRPGELFTMATTDAFWWDEAEPIWVSAEKAGIRTATMFWPGSNVPIHGTFPSDWQQFAQALPEGNRVAAIVDWLRRPLATRPRLLTLYFDSVDTAGHRFGPDSPEVRAAMRGVDARLGDLLAELGAMGQPVNLIVGADHGMAPVDAARTIDFNAVFPAGSTRVIEDGPYAAFEAMPGQEAAVRAAIARPTPHMRCSDKADLPTRLAYGRNRRVPRFICIAESGWMILSKPPKAPVKGGAHGYDNTDPLMRAGFVASGPAFGRGTVEGRNVDLYPLIRRLIGLPPAPGIDGSIAPFERILK